MFIQQRNQRLIRKGRLTFLMSVHVYVLRITSQVNPGQHKLKRNDSIIMKLVFVRAHAAEVCCFLHASFQIKDQA